MAVIESVKLVAKHEQKWRFTDRSGTLPGGSIVLKVWDGAEWWEFNCRSDGDMHYICGNAWSHFVRERIDGRKSSFTLYSKENDSSVFRWGLGFGIVYMMSAGRAEISKLKSAIDETAKVVQEIKTKICKRKSSCNVQASNSANEVAAGSKRFNGKILRLLLEKSGTGNRDPNEIRVCSLPVIEDGEYASSVLTEEPEPESEVVEMDLLEAELKLELQKLSEVFPFDRFIPYLQLH